MKPDIFITDQASKLNVLAKKVDNTIYSQWSTINNLNKGSKFLLDYMRNLVVNDDVFNEFCENRRVMRQHLRQRNIY